MQKCLNKEARHFDRQFKKHPILWLLMFLMVALSAILLTIAIMCNTSYICSNPQQDIMLWFGLMILVSLVVFVAIPNVLRGFLNCLYEESPKIHRVKKMSPLSSPNPPSTPPPKHALKSFREFTQAA